MAKYLISGSYTAQGAKGVLAEGGTGRREATERVVSSVGGTVESYYFGFGGNDFYLIADFPGDTKVLYGGGDDNDDSGSISYLSIRYGGKVVGEGTPEELAEHDCLVYSNLPDPTRWVCTDRDGVRHSIDVPVTMTASSGDFLCASAREGLGLVLQPTFIAGESISRGELQPVLTGYQWPVTPAYAIYPPTRHLSYRVREFIDFLAERFAGVPYWDRDCR